MPRQVAHALLTRPPLSLLHSIRRLPSINSVRLECVMHAASVHPEPGSNSRSIVLTSLPKECSNLSSFFLASFTFCLSSILLRISNEISFALYFFRFVLLQSLVVQFSMTNLLKPLKVTASLLYHKLIRFVKYFFSTFQNFFRGFCTPSRLRPCYITTSFPLCQYLF